MFGVNSSMFWEFSVWVWENTLEISRIFGFQRSIGSHCASVKMSPHFPPKVCKPTKSISMTCFVWYYNDYHEMVFWMAWEHSLGQKATTSSYHLFITFVGLNPNRLNPELFSTTTYNIARTPNNVAQHFVWLINFLNIDIKILDRKRTNEGVLKSYRS